MPYKWWLKILTASCSLCECLHPRKSLRSRSWSTLILASEPYIYIYICIYLYIHVVPLRFELSGLLYVLTQKQCRIGREESRSGTSEAYGYLHPGTVVNYARSNVCARTRQYYNYRRRYFATRRMENDPRPRRIIKNSGSQSSIRGVLGLHGSNVGCV